MEINNISSFSDNDEVKINEENNLKKELEELNKNLENIANIKFISPF